MNKKSFYISLVVSISLILLAILICFLVNYFKNKEEIVVENQSCKVVLELDEKSYVSDIISVRSKSDEDFIFLCNELGIDYTKDNLRIRVVVYDNVDSIVDDIEDITTSYVGGNGMIDSFNLSSGYVKDETYKVKLIFWNDVNDKTLVSEYGNFTFQFDVNDRLQRGHRNFCFYYSVV